MISVEVAFAPNSQIQLLVAVQLADGSSVADAITATGWQQQYSQIFDYSVGIFSQKVAWQTPVKTGDRIEVYRPLTIDPQNKRKLLSKKFKK